MYSTPVSTDVGVTVKKFTLLFCLKAVESPDNGKFGRKEVIKKICPTSKQTEGEANVRRGWK